MLSYTNNFFQRHCIVYSSILENNTKRVDLSHCYIGLCVSAVCLFQSQLKAFTITNIINRENNLIPPDAWENCIMLYSPDT